MRARILVVDDDVALAKALSRMLERAGHQVQLADRATTVLDTIDTSELDAIVTDIHMPEITGLELLQELRRRGKEVPVVILTGDPSLESAMRAMEFGAHRYLVKPVRFEDLKGAVDGAITMGRLARVRRETAELLAQRDTERTRRRELEAKFRSALDGLWMAFQPIVTTATADAPSEIIAYEALMRSREPALPHPGAVIGAAEELHSIHVLGRVTRALTATAIEQLPKPLLAFVNLHAHDLTDPELFEPSAPLSQHASRVVLELTERASAESITDVHERVAKLRALGFRIAIDDLGAGYAGLQYFAQLAPEYAKIDMSIVRNVHADPVRERIVVALVSLCQQLGIQVIAEGVETVEERDALVALGCDALQGYRFGKPAAPFAPATW